MKLRRVLPLVLMLTACKGRPNVRQDAIEAELRTRDRENRELQESLAATQNQTKALEGELQRRQGAPQVGGADNTVGLSLKDITIGTGTMGISQIGQAADEGFNVVIVPRDEDGSPLKAPGTAIISAVEILPNGTKASLGAWRVDGSDLRKLWKAGLFSTGYNVPVYWQRLPTSKNIRITVRFSALNGQTFEAEKEITIRLLVPGLGTSPN